MANDRLSGEARLLRHTSVLSCCSRERKRDPKMTDSARTQLGAAAHARIRRDRNLSTSAVASSATAAASTCSTCRLLSQNRNPTKHSARLAPELFGSAPSQIGIYP